MIALISLTKIFLGSMIIPDYRFDYNASITTDLINKCNQISSTQFRAVSIHGFITLTKASELLKAITMSPISTVPSPLTSVGT